MAATREGGLKAADKNRQREPNFYRRIGAIGGKLAYKDGSPRGFATDRNRAVEAGRKGGANSRQGRKL